MGWYERLLGPCSS